MEDFDGVDSSESMGEGVDTSSSEAQTGNDSNVTPDDLTSQSQESSENESVSDENAESAPAPEEAENLSDTARHWRGEYFKAKKTYEPRIAELESKVKEYEESQQQGILIDKPSSEWQPLEQIKSLPEKYQEKILDTVFDNFLPTFAEGVIKNPQAFPEQFARLEGIAINLIENASQRPFKEIAAIVSLTQGMSAQQLEQLLLSGQSGFQQPINGNGTYAPQPFAQTGAPNQQLYQLAQQAGLDLEDPSQQGFVNVVAQMQAANQRQLQALENKLTQYQSEQQKVTQKSQQQTLEQYKAEVDKKAGSVRQELLVSVTKDRVTKDDTRTPIKIQERAEYRLIRDEKAREALERARDYAADGFERGVRGEMAKYSARASFIYQEIAKEELGEKVKSNSALRTADQQKAARKDLATGAANANTNTGNSIDDWLKDKKIDPRNAGDLAEELARRVRQ